MKWQKNRVSGNILNHPTLLGIAACPPWLWVSAILGSRSLSCVQSGPSRQVMPDGVEDGNRFSLLGKAQKGWGIILCGTLALLRHRVPLRWI